MKSRDKIRQKTQRQTREEIIEDWADIRRWIDELQQEWGQRQDAPKTQKSKEPRSGDAK